MQVAQCNIDPSGNEVNLLILESGSSVIGDDSANDLDDNDKVTWWRPRP